MSATLGHWLYVLRDHNLCRTGPVSNIGTLAVCVYRPKSVQDWACKQHWDIGFMCLQTIVCAGLGLSATMGHWLYVFTDHSLHRAGPVSNIGTLAVCVYIP